MSGLRGVSANNFPTLFSSSATKVTVSGAIVGSTKYVNVENAYKPFFIG